MLRLEQLGKVTNFTAVPGCGLKCSVSNIESVIESEVADVETMNRRNSSLSTKAIITRHQSDEDGGSSVHIEGKFIFSIKILSSFYLAII